MVKELSLKTFEKLEALHLLIEENDLAIIEANIRLKNIDTIMNRFSSRLLEIKDGRNFDAMMRGLPELMQHKSQIETQLFNDRNNRMIFFSKSREIAEGSGIWEEPIKPSKSRR